ncbi:YraN family protein [Rhodoferax sp. TH121]|uniref:YraN family protein n=1 Tax=Rhodoferax sp. TH121 TaxID=2022803 RepID=UPI000B975162|nr:YraN family protein [Rhodoferax sp. TH121]OYQ42590.1 YraN family protein [Rhodoferax sp. TH121]
MDFFPTRPARSATTKQLGDAGEEAALRYLLGQGLKLVTRNYRTPGRGGGEIDLIMRMRDGTLVFVEVRKRASSRHGGGAASVGTVKQRRIVLAARHYLLRVAHLPPCRFDVVVLDGERIEWLQAAFDAT